jgi:hypothetical protein
MKDFFEKIDKKSLEAAESFCSNGVITDKIITTIIYLYEREKEINEYSNENFELAYHNPITSNLEFYIARILYYISSRRELNWKIFLRRQKKKCTPDIRVEKEGKTIFIVEIKAKAGWIQAFFSPETYKNEKLKGKYNPDDILEKQKKQLEKYRETFNTDNIYMFLPTFESVHRKKIYNKL